MISSSGTGKFLQQIVPTRPVTTLHRQSEIFLWYWQVSTADCPYLSSYYTSPTKRDHPLVLASFYSRLFLPVQLLHFTDKARSSSGAGKFLQQIVPTCPVTTLHRQSEIILWYWQVSTADCPYLSSYYTSPTKRDLPQVLASFYSKLSLPVQLLHFTDKARLSSGTGKFLQQIVPTCPVTTLHRQSEIILWYW